MFWEFIDVRKLLKLSENWPKIVCKIMPPYKEFTYGYVIWISRQANLLRIMSTMKIVLGCTAIGLEVPGKPICFMKSLSVSSDSFEKLSLRMFL